MTKDELLEKLKAEVAVMTAARDKMEPGPERKTLDLKRAGKLARIAALKSSGTSSAYSRGFEQR
jgi:hypothetical protein